MRREEIKRKRKMLEDLMSGKKSEIKKEKKEKKEEKKIDADVNRDGIVDEKDLQEVKKRIKKKKED